MTTVANWHDVAACRNAATAYSDPFFDESEKGERAAIAICRTCRVQGECLAFAISTGQPYGVWGGKPQRELRRLTALDRLGRANGHRPLPRHRPARNEEPVKKGGGAHG